MAPRYIPDKVRISPDAMPPLLPQFAAVPFNNAAPTPCPEDIWTAKTLGYALAGLVWAAILIWVAMRVRRCVRRNKIRRSWHECCNTAVFEDDDEEEVEAEAEVEKGRT